jgi:AmmeMemoRadiSam system protein B
MKLVPLLVGSVSESTAADYAEVFQEYWEDEETFWVISSDFCHWYVDNIWNAFPRTDRKSYTEQGNKIQSHAILSESPSDRQPRTSR